MSTPVCTCCLEIEPGPPLTLSCAGHLAMSAGPSQERSATCADSTAGVASPSSAVVTSPVRDPAFLASSSTVGIGLPSGVTEIAPLYVLCPVDQPLPLAAESVT